MAFGLPTIVLLALILLVMPCIFIEPTTVPEGTKNLSIQELISYERAAVFVLSITSGLWVHKSFFDWHQNSLDQANIYGQNTNRKTESYADYSARRQKNAWRSSSYGRKYRSYDEYSQSHKYQSGRRSRTSGSPYPAGALSEREKALKALGLTGSPSRAKIKSAYRNLVKRYHPDILMAQNASVQAQKMAQERMKAINVAYDRLCK